MKYFIIASFWLLTATPSGSQFQDEPIIANGVCDPRSGVTIGGGDQSKFSCDVAVIMRTPQGKLLIQFTDSNGDDGRILGFAGTIEGKQGFGADTVQAVAVERLYLAGGANPISTSGGTCFMNWTGLQRTGGRLTSVTCGAAARAEGSDIKAVASLKAG